MRRMSSAKKFAKKMQHFESCSDDLVDASIRCAIFRLLECSCKFGAMELADLSTAATVIQRLIASMQHAAELRKDRGDGCGKENGLSESALCEIEKQLKLL